MDKLSSIIHVGSVHSCDGWSYVFLCKMAPDRYGWFLRDTLGKTIPAAIEAATIAAALQLAHRIWKRDSFRTLKCGFRFTLPERDEHGLNALFFQMGASYDSMNGVYFDEDLGNNCIVHQASIEARELWKTLKQEYAKSPSSGNLLH